MQNYEKTIVTVLMVMATVNELHKVVIIQLGLNVWPAAHMEIQKYAKQVAILHKHTRNIVEKTS